VSNLLAGLRPLRTELLGVAGLTALLLLAAAGVTLRLLAFDLPAGCLDPESTAALCRGRQFDAAAYGSFVANWGGAVGISAALFPAVAGAILGIATVAKELDQRTAVFAWSVDASRRHWLLQRVVPLLCVIVLLAIICTFVVNAMLQLQHPGADVAATLGFEGIPYSGLGPMAAGISAFGIAIVVGSMLGRLLPTLMAAAALIVFANLLITQGNERLMAGESLVAEQLSMGQGRPIDSAARTPDGRIITWDEAYAQYGNPETGELGPEITQLVRYVPIEIYPQVAARYVLFHLLVGFAFLTLAFVVVERRSP
jgi:hypothetical protein